MKVYPSQMIAAVVLAKLNVIVLADPPSSAEPRCGPSVVHWDETQEMLARVRARGFKHAIHWIRTRRLAENNRASAAARVKLKEVKP